MRKHAAFLFVLLFAGWMLPGCRPAAVPAAPAVLQSSPTLPVLAPVRAVVSPTPTAELTPTPVASSTPVQPSPSPTATPVVFQVCSPLELTPLEELRLIIADPYHPPPPGHEERHHGVDFGYFRRGDRLSIEGEGVQAVLPGKVAAALADSYPYGNVVILESQGDQLPPDLKATIGWKEPESLYTLYAHMQNTPFVQPGDPVDCGTLVGRVGKSGNAGQFHLHLEARLGPPGQAFDVMGYYLAESTPEEQANYVRWRTSGDFRHFDPMTLLNYAMK